MSDNKKFFGTDGIRGCVGEYPINAEFFLKLGWAVGCVLAQKGGGKVLIGKDTRISGYMFESALEAGLSAAGVDIHLLGPMPTPAVAYLTRTLRAQAGIVISASHNPYQDNGIKFFSAQGCKLPDEIEQAIEKQLGQEIITVDSARLGKAVRIDDAPGRYIEFCKSTIPHNTGLKGLKIVVDCANGATYAVAPHVFRELGADVVEVGTEPNGLNINDHVGSTTPNTIQKHVLAEKAHLGIALDGDGDRVIMVDAKGEIVDGDELVFIITRDQFETQRWRGGLVGTQMSNYGLETAIKEMGIDFIRTQVGDRYVLEELEKRNWQLGGESSGHIICRFATTTGDGIISALQVLSAMSRTGKTLHELKCGMTKMPQILMNVNINGSSGNILQHPLMQQAIVAAEQQLANCGRLLIRPSGTEPLVRVMVEGEDSNQIKTIAEQLVSVVREVVEAS
jgi:phosphoglucosamine mutase